MTYLCINNACELEGEAISEKIARRHNFHCESCGKTLVPHKNFTNIAPNKLVNLSYITTRLPIVLAMPISEYFDEEHPVLKLWQICEIAELSLRMAVITGIAEHGKRLPNELVLALADRIERPTMGAWLTMAQAVVKHLPPTPVIPELNGMVEALARILGNQSSPPESGCLTLRNLLAHGGGMRKATAETLLSAWKPRFTEMVNALSWLANSHIVGLDSHGQMRSLKGPDPQGEAADGELLINVPDGTSTALWLVKGHRALPLWPFCRYAAPGVDDQNSGTLDHVPQLYIRRGEVRLQYVNFGGERAVSDSDESALDSFRDLFKVDDHPLNIQECSVPGFEIEIRKESGRRIGRENELAELRKSINTMQGGLLWLGGVAGMGKSCIVASLSEELIDSPPTGTMILCYRFRATDDRCSRERFLRFACERIGRWDGLVPAERELPETSQPIERLRNMLGRIEEHRQVIFIVDGMDEISESDIAFHEDVVIGLASKRAKFICAGRPERGIPEAFRQAGAAEPFPNGLPPMSLEDVRAMLVTRTEGPLRKRLIKRDKEAGERIINPFIERVARLSEGLPLYVNYVIGDILSGKLGPDDECNLPKGLHDYHDRLLNQCAIGDLQAIASALVAILALSYESLTVGEIADLLVRRGTLSDIDVSLVNNILSVIASMIRRSEKPNGEKGYALFHHSLRQHILKSDNMRHTVGAAQRGIGEAARAPVGDRATTYLYKWGITHLLDTRQRLEAIDLMTNFDYLMGRLATLPGEAGVYGISSDWRKLLADVPIPESAMTWERFWRTKEHLLLRANERWQTFKIFHQLALCDAKTSPITKAALSWTTVVSSSWPRLELSEADIPPNLVNEPSLFIMPGHTDWVNGCAISTDGALAATAGGRRFGENIVRLWNMKTHECKRILIGHGGPVLAVAVNHSGDTVASGSMDRTIRIWDACTGECRGVLKGSAGDVTGLRFSRDGKKLLSGCLDGNLRLWSLTEMRMDAVSTKHTSPIKALGCDDDWNIFVTAHSDGKIRIWDPQSLTSPNTLSRHSGAVLSLDVSHDGQIAVSGGEDGQICLWRLADLTCIFQWDKRPDSVAAVALTHDKNYVLSGCHCGQTREDALDTTLSIWNIADGTCERRFIGGSDSILGIAVATDDKVALSCGVEGSIRVWDLTARADQLRIKPNLTWVTQISASPDGSLAFSCADSGDLRAWDLKKRALLWATKGEEYQLWGVSLSPDRKIVAASSEDHSIILQRVDNGSNLAMLSGHSDPVNSVAFSPDGRYLASCAGNGSNVVDGSVRVWDIYRGFDVLVLGKNELQGEEVRFSPDGRTILSSSWDRRLIIWNTYGGARRVMRNMESSREQRGIAISPDGRQAVVGNKDGDVRAWSLKTGECRCIYKGHVSDVRRLSISADGRLLATVGDDYSLKCWDLESGAIVAEAFFNSWVTSVSFLGPQYRLLVFQSDGTMSRLTLRNLPVPGVPIVTAVRLWLNDLSHLNAESIQCTGIPGRWDNQITATCPWCGNHVSAAPEVVKKIEHYKDALEDHACPCLDLPEEAWQASALLSTCSRCGKALKFNPFLVDNSKSTALVS